LLWRPLQNSVVLVWPEAGWCIVVPTCCQIIVRQSLAGRHPATTTLCIAKQTTCVFSQPFVATSISVVCSTCNAGRGVYFVFNLDVIRACTVVQKWTSQALGQVIPMLHHNFKRFGAFRKASTKSIGNSCLGNVDFANDVHQNQNPSPEVAASFVPWRLILALSQSLFPPLVRGCRSGKARRCDPPSRGTGLVVVAGCSHEHVRVWAECLFLDPHTYRALFADRIRGAELDSGSVSCDATSNMLELCSGAACHRDHFGAYAAHCIHFCSSTRFEADVFSFTFSDHYQRSTLQFQSVSCERRQPCGTSMWINIKFHIRIQYTNRRFLSLGFPCPAATRATAECRGELLVFRDGVSVNTIIVETVLI
jgi:hypothetical protein